MDFRAIVDEVLAGYFRAYPVQATEIGQHAHDGRWPDLTDAGRAARLAWVTDASAQVEAAAPDALSRDDAIDRRILLENLAAIRFAEETLDEGSWNPMTYVYVFGNGLFSLLAREFAPLPDRMRSVAARLRRPACRTRPGPRHAGRRRVAADRRVPHPEGGRADARPGRPGRHRGRRRHRTWTTRPSARRWRRPPGRRATR